MSELDFCEGYLLGITGGALPFDLISNMNITFPVGSEKYIYKEFVLQSPTWDLSEETGYPYAIMSCVPGQPIYFYFSKNPIYCESKGGRAQAVINGPVYRREYQYGKTYEDHKWINLIGIQESVYFNQEHILWATHSIIKPNGQFLYKTYSPKKFEYNNNEIHTAFLNKNNRLILQANSFYDKPEEISAIFVNWMDKAYDLQKLPPWLLFHQEVIEYATLEEGINPVSTKAWFYKCKKLRSATIKTNLEEIGDYMFYETQLGSSINSLFKNVKRIGKSAFCGVTSTYWYNDYYKVIIPDNVEYIDERAFYNIFGITELTLNGGETIQSYAFSKDGQLTRVTIGEKVKKIAPYAFEEIGLQQHVGHYFDEKFARVKFEDTENWKVFKNESDDEGISINVENPEQNGKNISTYFPGKWNSILGPTPPNTKGKYNNYYWVKKENDTEVTNDLL